jgi:hypothetical protein
MWQFVVATQVNDRCTVGGAQLQHIHQCLQRVVWYGWIVLMYQIAGKDQEINPTLDL